MMDGGPGEGRRMQILSRGEEWDGERPERCRGCGDARLHCHGSYPRWVVWAVEQEATRVRVERYLCVGCRRTTSVLLWGILTYRLLSLAIVAKHLYASTLRRWGELLARYRRRWENGYRELNRAVGRLFGGRDLPEEAQGGWCQLMEVVEVNPELVDQTGWSLFGRYRIHTPLTVQ
jgi:hypothetical protein